MKIVKFSMGAVSLLGLLLSAETANALAWYGFSELTFYGEWKGGAIKDGELTVNVTDYRLAVQCENIQTGEETCQPGGGNSGTATLSQTVDANEDPTKEKGVITATGSFDLSKWDHHVDDPDQHQHLCQPVDNKNKIEVPGTARVTWFKANYLLSQNGKNTVGVQECYWTGSIVANQDPNEEYPGACKTTSAGEPGVDPPDFVCITQEEKVK